MTLIVLALGWLIGLVAVGVFEAPWWMGAAWIAAILPVLLARTPLSWRLAAASLACSALAGILLSGAMDERIPTVVAYLGEAVEISGVVVSEPDPGRVTTSYEVRIDELRASDATVRDAGTIRATLHQYADFLPGDRILLSGELEEPPVFDGFDYRSYLRQQGIWATMLRPSATLIDDGSRSVSPELTRLRLALDQSLQRTLPEPEASLGAGIAFGRDGNLSQERKEDYNASGLRHLVAVSGSNISLVTALTLALAVPVFGRRRAWIPAAVTIGLYLLVAGFSPSVVRAGIMAAILLVGGTIGRPQSGLPALAGAFIAMTALDPLDALEPGFQLSMAATAGLLTIAPWLSHWFERWSARRAYTAVPTWTCEVAALSVAASIATAPIMWVHFGELSLVGPLANIVVQPVLLLAFWLSIWTAVVGLFSETTAWWFSIAAYYPLAFIDGVASAAAGLPFATLRLGPGNPGAAAGMLAGMTALAGLAYRFPPPAIAVSARVERRRARSRHIIAGAAAGAFAFVAVPVTLLPAGGPGELRIDFLDVGQGDAILLTAPDGTQLLVDGGPSGIDLARQISAVTPHWDRTLDMVVLTHPHEDHIGGLPELFERYEVDTVVSSTARNTSTTVAAFEDGMPTLRYVSAGESLGMAGLEVDVLWPPANYQPDDLNDASVVLRIRYGAVSVLLTGDIGPEAQREVLDDIAPATILKVPHHGSRTNDPGFLAAVGAQLAVINVGAENQFGHPHQETLAALSNATILRTDLHGRITLRTDGQTIRVSTSE